MKIISALYTLLLMLTVLSTTRCFGDHDINRMIEKSFSQFKGSYIILVRKNKFTLEIIGRDKNIVASYLIGYGSNPDKKAKLYEGDNRTPEGEYSIVEILSMDAGKNTNSYGKLAALNKIYFRAKDGHGKINNPGEDLGDNAYGPRFFLLSYPNDNDKKNYQKNLKEGKIPKLKGKTPGIGFGIAIHGNSDESSIGHLCTSGCVRMYNSDIVELDRYIQVGMPVIITSE